MAPTHYSPIPLLQINSILKQDMNVFQEHFDLLMQRMWPTPTVLPEMDQYHHSEISASMMNA